MSNLKQSLRIFRKRPAIVGLIVVVLGLGLGANAAMFTVVNGLLLRPLPYLEPDRLVDITRLPASALRSKDSRSRTLAEIGGFTTVNQPIGPAGDAAPVLSMRASINLFRVLGVKAAFGRVFEPETDDASAAVVVLSNDYWRQISNDRAIIGTSLTIASRERRIIGVLPPDFALSNRNISIWIPDELPQSRVVARLAEGASAASAEAELRGIAQSLGSSAGSIPPDQQVRVVPVSQAYRVASRDSQTVLLLQAALGFILLITGANVASLLLLLSRARQQEFAIRAAIGAGRVQVFRQVLLESFWLTAISTAVAFAITRATVGLIATRLPGAISSRLVGGDGLVIDARVLLFTAGLSLILVFFCGLAMIAGAWRINLASTLQSAGRAEAPRRGLAGQALVIGEIGVSVMLLIGAGLVLKDLWQLETASFGFDPQHVIRARFEPVGSNLDPAQRVERFARAIQSLEGIPGVEAVGAIATQIFPFSGTVAPTSRFVAEKIPDADVRADILVVNSDYFKSLRIPLLRGRGFSNSDSADATPVAILSEQLARQYWGDSNPVGQRIRLNGGGSLTSWATVIGIAGNVRNASGLELQRIVYRPFTQASPSGMAFMIRTNASDTTVMSAARASLKEIDPTAPQYPLVGLDSALSIYWDSPRFSAMLWTAFGGFGVLVAILGVYGTLRSWVSARACEFGIRLAMGAQRRDILALVVQRSLKVCSFGFLLGLAGGLSLRRVIATQLVGANSLDPAIVVSVLFFVLVAALLATLLPALSAAQTDPVVAIKR